MGAELLGIRPIERMSCLVFLDLGLQPLVLSAVPPGSGKLVGCPGRPILESRAHNTLQRARHGGQEVRSCLPCGAVKTQVDEVLSCFVCGAKEDLTALVQHSCLVKQVVRGLRGLVDRDTCCAAEELRLQPQGLAKLNSVCRVKSSSRVVPALQRCPRKSGLRDGHTLPLSTRDTTDVLVSDAGVDSVGDTEHGHDDIPDVVREERFGDATWQLARRTRS